MKYHDDVKESLFYCCKQCAIRLRESENGKTKHRKRAWEQKHGPRCQGIQCCDKGAEEDQDAVTSYNNVASNKDASEPWNRLPKKGGTKSNLSEADRYSAMHEHGRQHTDQAPPHGQERDLP